MGKALEHEMNDYFMRLNDAEKKSVIQLIKNFLQRRKDGFTPPSVEEYSRELERADEEVANGDYISHEEVMKRYMKE